MFRSRARLLAARYPPVISIPSNPLRVTMFATPATACDPYVAEAPSRRISTRSISSTGNVLMSKKLCPTSLDTGANPALRPLISVSVEDRPTPRRLNCAAPCR